MKGTVGAVGGIMSGAEFCGTSEPCLVGGWPEVRVEPGRQEARVAEELSAGSPWKFHRAPMASGKGF